MNKAIFLDKDGTLVDNSKYPEVIPTHELLDDIILGLIYLQRKGYKLIIVSNQSWIGKGKLSKKEVEEVFRVLLAKLAEYHVKITDYYYCPHIRTDGCSCKKPSAGLLLQAVKEHNIDLSKSYMVGDMDKDIQAGKAAGVKTILVRTGKGMAYDSDILPDHDIRTLNHVKRVI